MSGRTFQKITVGKLSYEVGGILHCPHSIMGGLFSRRIYKGSVACTASCQAAFRHRDPTVVPVGAADGLHINDCWRSPPSANIGGG